MKSTAILFALGILPFLANAETITGQYTSDTPYKKGDVSIVNKRTGKNTQPDKKGRFSLKDTDPRQDTLVLYSATSGKASFVPMKGCVEFVIKEDKNRVDVVQRRAPFEPTSEHSGQIYMKESLERTGESMTLAAINAKVPRSNVATTFNGSLEPIYFVDGLEVSEISTLPLSEVAYVEVVRPSNPACTELGARGANGMILVTTESNYRMQNPHWNEPMEYHWEMRLGAGEQGN
ncbi:MAG: hypothetical protein K6F48_10465 [Paludibacteraceae bacterium]|nr:hypothetical protein [Paludibacteraceae bacterium]